MKIKRPALLLCAILLLTLFASGCGQNSEAPELPIERTGLLLGTVVQLKIYEPVDETVFDEAFALLGEIESKMSLKLEDSEINAVNRQAGIGPVRVSDETFYVIEKGLSYGALSGGRFDISIGPLVGLWGIGTEEARIPAPDEIGSALQTVDYAKVRLDSENKTVFLETPGMILDLGGIAKGYAADVLSELFTKKGVRHAIINLGGNVFVHGSKPDGSPWRIGIQNPDSERYDYIGSVSASNQAIVTSGIYERFFMAGDVRYHHILSPFDGYPFNNSLAGVSIITGKSIDADALSTVAFSLGIEEGYDLLESLEGVDGVFITRDKEIRITSGLKGNFKLSDPEFTLLD